MGPRVIVRVEEGTVSARGIFTGIVVVTRAVAVLTFLNSFSRQRKVGTDRQGPSERCCQVCGKDIWHCQLNSAELLGILTASLKREKEIILKAYIRLRVYEHGSV